MEREGTCNGQYLTGYGAGCLTNAETTEFLIGVYVLRSLAKGFLRYWDEMSKVMG